MFLLGHGISVMERQLRPSAVRPRPPRLAAFVACCHLAGPSWPGCDVVRAVWLARQAIVLVGGRPGRPMITNSREGAKPRSSDERRTIFRQSSRAASVESFLGKGHPGTMAPSARRARMCTRSHSGAGGRSGLRDKCVCLRRGQFSGRWISKAMPSIRY